MILVGFFHLRIVCDSMILRIAWAASPPPCSPPTLSPPTIAHPGLKSPPALLALKLPALGPPMFESCFSHNMRQGKTFLYAHTKLMPTPCPSTKGFSSPHAHNTQYCSANFVHFLQKERGKNQCFSSPGKHTALTINVITSHAYLMFSPL